MSLADVTTGEIVPAERWLGRLADGERLLADIATTQDALDVIDLAEAARVYAKEMHLGNAAANHATVIKLRAERRLADVVDEGQAAGRIATKGKSPESGDFVTLTDLKIKDQRLAEARRIRDHYTDDELLALADECNERDKQLARNQILQAIRAKVAQDTQVRPRLHVVGDGLPEAGFAGTDRVFCTIVADPPWQYGNTTTRNAADKHYPTMTVQELCDLPVEAHANDDCHLYLWATAPLLREAFDVMAAWGFSYKTNLVWVKPQIGMGNYFRVSHEHVLFGVRGSSPILRKDARSWFQADRAGHSAKPDAFLDLVESCSPSPGLEMFARRRRMGEFGWTYWGNEA